MKRINNLALGLIVLAVSCTKDPIHPSIQKELVSGGASGVDTLVGIVTGNTTVTRNTYLKGLVYVAPGVTLTINPGLTIICGPSSYDGFDQSKRAGALVIEQGAKIIANGTPAQPIVWTSPRPAGSRSPGNWGGIILLGKSPIRVNGVPSSNAAISPRDAWSNLDPKDQFGGTDADDNSGSITYNRIEFAGNNQPVIEGFGGEAVLAGLQLYGVGKGTTIHHIETKNCLSDGFRFVGGTVSAHHLIAYDNVGNDYSFLLGYQGQLQFIIGYRTYRCGPVGSKLVWGYGGQGYTSPFIANATLLGPADTTGATGIGRFFLGVIQNRNRASIRIANSLIIGQLMPYVLGNDDQARQSWFDPNGLNGSYMHNDIVQTNSSSPVVLNSAPDAELAGTLSSGSNQNSVLPDFAAFKLNGALAPLAGSPALGGGVNLSANGFFGTTERGAVISSDPWTSINAGWISTSVN